MKPIFEAIAARYHFVIPQFYVEMESRHWFDSSDEANYLWLYEAEWLTPEQIAHYQFAPYHQPGFVPFAFTGGGDLWCWWPASTEGTETPIVLCPHDSNQGQFYASQFSGFLYRQILDYATDGCIDASWPEAQGWLQLWHQHFAGFFPSEWSDTVLSLASKSFPNRHPEVGFITQHQNDEIVQRDLAFPRLEEKFRWMI